MAGNGIVPNANVQDDYYNVSFPMPGAKNASNSDAASTGDVSFPMPKGEGLMAPSRKAEYWNNEDVMKGAGSGALRGGADVIGMPGDIERAPVSGLFGYAMKKLGDNGIVNPQFISDVGKKYQDFDTAYKANLKKYGVPEQYFPTSEEVKEAGAPLGTQYKPTSQWGERAQSGVESGVSNLIGGPEGMVARGAAGLVGGAFGTTVRQNMENSPYAAVMGPAADVFGQLATGHLIDAVKNFPTTARAQANLISALTADFQNGTAKISRDQLENMIKTGVPLNIADIGGTETRSALEKAASVTPSKKYPKEAGAYNESLDPRKIAEGEESRLTSSQGRMNELLTNEAGAPLDPAAMTGHIEEQGRKELKQVYDIARDPTVIKANSIYASELDPAIQRNPIFHDAVVNAGNRVANEMDQSVFKQPSWSQTTGEQPGNIAFWDIVKRDLDAQWNKAKISGDNDAARQVDAVRKQLIEHLDGVSPEYKAARDKASEFFNSVSAPEAGQNFYRKADTMKTADFENAYNQYNDTQKAYFKNGFLSSMNADMGRPKGASVLAGKLTTDPEFQRKSQLVLGKNYDNIRNSVLAESLYTTAQQLPQAGGRSPLGFKDALLSVGSLGAGPAFQALMDGAVSANILDPKYLLALAPAAAVSAGAAARARAVAQRTISLAASGDPKDFAAIAKLASNNPVAQRTLEGLNQYYQAISQQGTPLTNDQQTGRFAGGRVGRASGGRTGKNPKVSAEKLIALADRVKNEQTKNTEPLLNLDDTTVAKALAVANKHI